MATPAEESPSSRRRGKASAAWVLLACAALFGGCAAFRPLDTPVTGEWGGEHVHLKLTESGGTLAYDCAAGTIAGPLRLDADGVFSAVGTHTAGKGGVETEGAVPPTYRVRYAGVVRGARMRLHGRVDNGEVLGPFSLRRGAESVFSASCEPRKGRVTIVQPP
jgi:hypothetical protein